jgi:magnesium transporter
MNFNSMPEVNWPLGYALAIGLTIATTGLTLWYFRRKGWL